VEIKISILASGEFLLEGQPAALAQIDSRLAQASAVQDQVLIYKEDPRPDSTRHSMEIVKLVIKHKLPVSFSAKADFSDYVDQFGQSHSRTAGSTPSDAYARFMPDVDERRDAAQVFAEARTAARKTPDGRGVALVGPDRAVMVLPVPQRSAEMDARLSKLPDIPSDRPHHIAAIVNTSRCAASPGEPPQVQEIAKVVPFLGYLIALGYAGHHVWAFEGHASALTLGLEHAEILLLDSGMLPLLRADWMDVAQRVMDGVRRVLIFTRERPSFVPAVPSATPQGWTYGEPDGERSYVNCLLTTLAKAGAGASAEILTMAPLPDLAALTHDAAELDWIAHLPFRYDRLDAAKAIEVLTHKRSANELEKPWTLKTVLVAGGEQRKCEFSLRLAADGPRRARLIRVL
jgi:hypothetical protein